MGLLDLFFGKKKSDRSKLEKETRNTVHRGCVTTTRVNVSSRNYEELLHRFIAFDTETTGLSSQMDIIIEVGAVKFSDGRIDNTYGSLINEGRSVPDEAYRVNHISTDMLRSKGKAPGLAYRELTDFLGDVLEGKCYICAHNASFDMDFLKNTLERFGYSGNILYIDTLSLSRHLIKGLPNYKQETIANYFGLHNQNAHRAVTDAEICGNIFLNLLELMKNEIEKEIIRAANCKPSDEEREVFAIIAKAMKMNGCSVKNIRTYRNSSNYVDVLDVYTIFKFKIAKKKSYIVIPRQYAYGIDKFEDCTNSEGTENIRLIFEDPFELEKYGHVFAAIYKDVIRSQGQHMNRYEADFLAQANLTGFSEAELEQLIEDAKKRQERNAGLRELEKQMKAEQEAVNEAKKAERARLKAEAEEKKQRKSDAQREQQNAVKKMLENANNLSKEEIYRISELSSSQGKRAVIQMDDEGHILRIFESVSEASKTVGLAPKTIRDAANGRYKHAGGFCWKYADEVSI